MKATIVVLLLYCTFTFIAAEEADTRELVDSEDSEDLARKHRKRKKHQQNNGGCGGYGRTFGEKFFGLHDYTYVSAPVMNYFFGCGVAALPVAPVAPSPIVASYPSHGHGGHGGHGGGHGGHGGGHGGHGGGYGGNYGTPGGQVFGGINQPYQQPIYGQGSYQRPFQGAISAAASGLGSALADYISRPKKTQKIINRQVNQFLRPIYRLF